MRRPEREKPLPREGSGFRYGVRSSVANKTPRNETPGLFADAATTSALERGHRNSASGVSTEFGDVLSGVQDAPVDKQRCFREPVGLHLPSFHSGVPKQKRQAEG